MIPTPRIKTSRTPGVHGKERWSDPNAPLPLIRPISGSRTKGPTKELGSNKPITEENTEVSFDSLGRLTSFPVLKAPKSSWPRK